MGSMEEVIGVREIRGGWAGDRERREPGRKMGLISDFFKSECGDKGNCGDFLGGVPEKIGSRSLRDLDGNGEKP